MEISNWMSDSSIINSASCINSLLINTQVYNSHRVAASLAKTSMNFRKDSREQARSLSQEVVLVHLEAEEAAVLSKTEKIFFKVIYRILLWFQQLKNQINSLKKQVVATASLLNIEPPDVSDEQDFTTSIGNYIMKHYPDEVPSWLQEGLWGNGKPIWYN